MPDYQFTAAAPNTPLWSGKLMNYPYPRNPERSAEESTRALVHFRAALLRLFGPPNGPEGDDVFPYTIVAHGPDSQQWLLSAYQGPSGPAIGSINRDDATLAAAVALLALIDATEPADFTACYYSEEYDSTVTYGCLNGDYFYGEEFGDHTGGEA